jgi:hypothetical protein
MTHVPPSHGGLRRVLAPEGTMADAAQAALRDRGAVTGPRVASQIEVRKRGTLRSQELMQAIASLDTHPSAEAVAKIMDWIRDEYDARGGGALAGLFGRCYLGPPYVDHVMTTSGDICEHYTPADSVPLPYGAARSLAASPAYLFVEVYTDGTVVPIRPDGSAVV